MSGNLRGDVVAGEDPRTYKKLMGPGVFASVNGGSDAPEKDSDRDLNSHVIITDETGQIKRDQGTLTFALIVPEDFREVLKIVMNIKTKETANTNNHYDAQVMNPDGTNWTQISTQTGSGADTFEEVVFTPTVAQKKDCKKGDLIVLQIDVSLDGDVSDVNVSVREVVFHYFREHGL